MRQGQNITVIMPALNEERSIAKVIADIPAWADTIIVADNGSTDATRARATAAGAHVVSEPEPGYGAACLAAIARAAQQPTPPDIIVFLDSDYSDYPEQMDRLVDPIARGAADFVVGSRTRGTAARGALMPQQRFGNWLATTLIRIIWQHRYTDLGPFRAIRASRLADLAMTDRAYGWTVEMQIRALERGLTVQEAAVDYRPRIGHSKVSGTVIGSLRAGIAILGIIARHARTKAAARTAPLSETGRN